MYGALGYKNCHESRSLFGLTLSFPHFVLPLLGDYRVFISTDIGVTLV